MEPMLVLFHLISGTPCKPRNPSLMQGLCMPPLPILPSTTCLGALSSILPHVFPFSLFLGPHFSHALGFVCLHSQYQGLPILSSPMPGTVSSPCIIVRYSHPLSGEVETERPFASHHFFFLGKRVIQGVSMFKCIGRMGRAKVEGLC